MPFFDRDLTSLFHGRFFSFLQQASLPSPKAMVASRFSTTPIRSTRPSATRHCRLPRRPCRPPFHEEALHRLGPAYLDDSTVDSNGSPGCP